MTTAKPYEVKFAYEIMDGKWGGVIHEALAVVTAD
jgi:hypothetical protein